jgi:hypothetical protein
LIRKSEWCGYNPSYSEYIFIKLFIRHNILFVRLQDTENALCSAKLYKTPAVDKASIKLEENEISWNFQSHTVMLQDKAFCYVVKINTLTKPVNWLWRTLKRVWRGNNGKDAKWINILEGTPKYNKSLRSPKRRWQDNIKVGLKKVGCEVMNFITRSNSGLLWQKWRNFMFNKTLDLLDQLYLKKKSTNIILLVKILTF